MKKIFIICIFILFVGSFLYAQNCEAYIPSETGKKLMYKTTNKKGKLQSYHSHQLLSKSEKDDGIHFEIHYISYDKDKEMISEDTLQFSCKNDVFYIDMNSYLNKEQLAAYDESQIEITLENPGYPGNLKPGTVLKDGYVEANINAGMVLTFRTDLQNRKVESQENITTEAGTFNTMKISEDIISKLGFVSIKMSSVSWIKPNIGNIRSESYDKKGNLTSVTELISIY